jgi:uncharacterized protein (TIGR02246 family)
VEIWEVVARESIRATLARYNAAGDRGQLAELASCFTPDGVLRYTRDDHADGRQEIERQLTELTLRAKDSRRSKYVHHHVSTLDIELMSQAEARVRSYFHVITERGLDHWGRYDDLVVAYEGRWLIKERKVSTDGRVEGSWAETAGG